MENGFFYRRIYELWSALVESSHTTATTKEKVWLRTKKAENSESREMSTRAKYATRSPT